MTRSPPDNDTYKMSLRSESSSLWGVTITCSQAWLHYCCSFLPINSGEECADAKDLDGKIGDHQETRCSVISFLRVFFICSSWELPVPVGISNIFIFLYSLNDQCCVTCSAIDSAPAGFGSGHSCSQLLFHLLAIWFLSPASCLANTCVIFLWLKPNCTLFLICFTYNILEKIGLLLFVKLKWIQSEWTAHNTWPLFTTAKVKCWISM